MDPELAILFFIVLNLFNELERDRQARRRRVVLLRTNNVIAACAVLHNIYLGVGDVVAPEDSPEDNTEEDEGEEDTVSAAQWRDRLSAEMSALEEVQMDHEYL
uniref:DDE Tnp4 domain-containing protein n=1 Tax=Knipowitschia caucasica TaxID=637954 RepID=A0AAV2J117_KNICA